MMNGVSVHGVAEDTACVHGKILSRTNHQIFDQSVIPHTIWWVNYFIVGGIFHELDSNILKRKKFTNHPLRAWSDCF